MHSARTRVHFSPGKRRPPTFRLHADTLLFARRQYSLQPRPMPRKPNFTRDVYRIVRRIPAGRVTSYSAVAAMLGAPRAARGVGWALAALPLRSTVPWWRVVNRDGAISIRFPPHAAALQRQLLVDEGVHFDATDRIDWSRFAWRQAEQSAG